MATSKKGITVRFEDDEMEALDALAKKYKVTSATIIRWALAALDDYVKANGGRVILPLDFNDFLKAAKPVRDFDRGTTLNEEPEAKTGTRSRA